MDDERMALDEDWMFLYCRSLAPEGERARALGVMDRYHPAVAADGSLRTADGERVLWSGQALVRELWMPEELDDADVAWTLPETVRVYLTDWRLAFVCERWEVGGGWTSHGAAPVTTALLNAASRAKAAMNRRGKVMVGQVRWQWPRSVHCRQLRTSGRRFGMPTSTVHPAVLLLCAVARRKGYAALEVPEGSAGCAFRPSCGCRTPSLGAGPSMPATTWW